MKKFINQKTIFLTLLIIFLFLLSPQIIFAGDGTTSVLEGLNKTADAAKIEKGEKASNLPAMIGSAINYIFGIVGVVFLAIILVGGVFWMTAGGNEEKMSKAKKFIMNGVSGMIIIFLAYALVYMLLAALGGATATS